MSVELHASDLSVQLYVCEAVIERSCLHDLQTCILS